MRLILDLRMTTVHQAGGAERETRVRPQDLAARARRPASLVRLLFGTRWQSVTVVRDELPLNGVQAGAALLVGIARARAFEVARRGQAVAYGRWRFLVRAAVDLAVGLPLELATSARALLRVLARARCDSRLPTRRSGRGPVLYLYRPLSAMGSTTGGATAHTAGVVDGLAANGLAVEILGPQRPPAAHNGVFRHVPLRRRYHVVQWLTVSEYSRELAAAAATRDADFVYERSIAGSYAGVAVARRLGVPLVLEFNGSDVWIAENWGGRRLAAARLAASLENRNLRSASLVVVLSRVLEDQVLRLGVPPERILVNPVGADIEAMACLREREPQAWRSDLGLEQGPTVAFVGTFGRWHGVELLPEMLERTAKLRPDARWLLIGGGPLHARVSREIARRRLGDRVTMTGAVARDDALRLLAGAEVCVSPHVPNPDGSRFFGSPTKLFEYMGLGRAIVASDLEQIGELIDHGRNGLLHRPGDAAAAATAVARLLDEPQTRARLGAEALRDALERYTWKAHVARILTALDEADRGVIAPSRAGLRRAAERGASISAGAA